MAYAREFFELQYRFGERAAVVLGHPLAEVLLSHTNLFVRLGCGRAPNAGDPLWREYVAGLAGASDGVEWTWRFHRAHAQASVALALAHEQGCFGFERLAPGRLRLHFRPTEAHPLGAQRVAARSRDLGGLVAQARGRESGAVVVGASWLYHLPAYRRLFPPAYLATARALEPPPWQRLPLWGQFLDGQGRLRDGVMVAFLRQSAKAQDERGLAACFPLPVLALQAPLAWF